MSRSPGPRQVPDEPAGTDRPDAGGESDHAGGSSERNHAGGSSEPDELDGLVDPRDLDLLRSYERMAPEKPWMRELAIRERERLILLAHARAGDHLKDRHRARVKRGGTVTITVRLEPRDLNALESRAAFLGLRPSALVRNLIRVQVASADTGRMAGLLDELEDVLARLRRTVC